MTILRIVVGEGTAAYRRVVREGARMHSIAGSRPSMYACAVGGTETSGANAGGSPFANRKYFVE
jgi:hypothetical protein